MLVFVEGENQTRLPLLFYQLILPHQLPNQPFT